MMFYLIQNVGSAYNSEFYFTFVYLQEFEVGDRTNSKNVTELS